MTSTRKTFVLGRGSALGAATPLMSDATRWGDLVLLSGRADVDPQTGEVRGQDFASQAGHVMDDVLAVLQSCGSGPEHVLRVECWLSDPADFGAWNALFAATFPSPRPARTTLVGAFALPGLLIEVQVTAGVPS